MKPSIFPPGAEPILRRLYPDIAAIQAAFRAIRAEGVPTEQQIRLKARKAGIARMSSTAPFSDAEDAAIDRLYPDIPACRAEMPTRSKREIQRRAWYLKKARAGGPFTLDEDAVIRRLAPDVAAIQAQMPARSLRAITRQMGELGLSPTIGKHQRYTTAHLRLVRIFYPNYDLLSALLAPRTRAAIKANAGAMGLTAGKVAKSSGGYTSAWTDEEKAALSKYGVKLPGRSRSAIESARLRFDITVEPNPAIAHREARNAARRAASQAQASKRRAEAAARAEELRRRNVAWAAQKIQEIEAKRSAQAEVQKRERAAAKAVREERAQATRAEARARPVPTTPVHPAPAMVRIHRAAIAPTRKGDGIDPRVLSAAGASRYGIELVATVQRTVPRDLWPHVKPRVIEDLTMAVVEGRCAPDGLAEMLPGVIEAAMRNQFEGADR